MARRSHHAEHENHERWLVSYADFVTLLFAFFVVMFASSQKDKVRTHEMAESVKESFQKDRLQAAVASMLGKPAKNSGAGSVTASKTAPPQQATAAQLEASLKQLNEQLAQELAKGEVQMILDGRGLTISLRQSAFFPSGTDDVAPATYPTLDKISQIVGKLAHPIRLEGHTDAIPIRTARFRSNWELSAARSIAVLELLTERGGLDRHRFAVAGYADSVPLASNDTTDGRARNRRVDLVILTPTGHAREPQAH